MTMCVCGRPVYGASIHACCARWWDGVRCIGCHASEAAARGDIWRAHHRVEQAGDVRGKFSNTETPL